MSPFRSHLEFSHFVRTMRKKNPAAVYMAHGVPPFDGYRRTDRATVLVLQGSNPE